PLSDDTQRILSVEVKHTFRTRSSAQKITADCRSAGECQRQPCLSRSGLAGNDGDTPGRNQTGNNPTYLVRFARERIRNVFGSGYPVDLPGLITRCVAFGLREMSP